MKKILLFFLWAGFVSAQEKPSQFQHAASIAGAGSDSHYRITLPAATYRGVTRADLGDLRVFNGAGDPVPYAFVPPRPKPPAAEQRAARLFPLHGEEAKGIEAVKIRIQQKSGTIIDVSSDAPAKAQRKLLGYLVDAAELKAPLEALELDWVARQGFTGHARVEASDDLKSWRTVTAAAPLLYLEHAGQRLERKRVELAGARAKYLRLSFTGVPGDFSLRQARLELRGDRPEPAREWLGIAGKESPKVRGEYEFDTGGHFPVDRLRFALPEINTVAQVQIFFRARTEDPWVPATSATLYRLRRDSGEVVNPDVAVFANASRYWLLRVDQKGGGLGSGEVRLEIGWIPHEVVFAARGAGPFTLAYGMKIARPGSMPIAAVLPGYREGEPVALKTATLGEASAARRAPSGFSEYLSEAAESGEAKKWLLWAALVGGVLVLVWMAFALLRQVGKT